MKKTIVIVLVLLISFNPFSYSQAEQVQVKSISASHMEGLAPGEPLPALPQSPLYLTGTTPEQLAPDYWINRLSNPDRPLKTPEQLKFFNQEIDMMLHERMDIFQPRVLPSGTQIRNVIKSEYDTVSNRKLFGVDDKYIPKSFFETQIKPNVHWETVPDKLSAKWGAATRATSVRALPTTVKMLEEKRDIEFDQLQYTLIKLWTPVAILHTSNDGAWHYVQAPYVRGWVKSKYIAVFSSKTALQEKVKAENFLVVTGESISLCADSSCLEEYYRPSMGTLLPLIEKNAQGYVVQVPVRSSGGAVAFKNLYVHRASGVHVGFPAFTQRNIINQAFKLLGQRYGWGGMYNGRDCSGFTHDVFLSLGVDLPRDSDQQALVGTQLGHFEVGEDAAKKVGALRVGTPAITMLKMSMHMMLYLGEVDGRFFIIHSTWAERISMTSDEKRRINQVVVSDLSLNGNSYLGSLFDRTISINELN
jgi:hypothetical protein